MQLKGQNMKVVRKGCNSEIYLVEDSGKQIAIKAVCTQFIKETKHLLNEWNILKNISHPHVIKAYRCTPVLNFHSNNTDNDSNYTLLAQEYAHHGNLLQYLKKNKLTLTEKVLIMKKVFQAINYLHCNSIVHRDIKLDNILIFPSEHTVTPKIADFGFAQTLLPHHTTANSYKGTRRGYMAPQIHQAKDNPQYTYELMPADVFALGVALFAFILQKLPFEYATQTNAVYKLIAERRFEDFWNVHKASLQRLKSEEQVFNVQQFCCLFQGLVCFEADKRLSIKEGMEHDFFQQYD